MNVFQKVEDTFRENFSLGHEFGASFSVFKEGRPIIDIFGGYIDHSNTTKWNKNTIVNVHSTGKGLVSICIAMLVDRKLLKLDEKVSFSDIYDIATKS